MARGETYEQFTDKFKPKLTTDDCYTPSRVYDVVRDWAVKEYGLEGREVVRPFYPGGDYERFDYPRGGVVIDNPPFSILSKIIDFYQERKIPFFLFAPMLVLFANLWRDGVNAVAISESIIYENGAKVATGFLTNLGEWKIRTAPDLHETIKQVQEEMKETVALPKYEYPEYVLTAASLARYAKYGVDFRAKASEVSFTRALDCQRSRKKSIYGAGFLLSEHKTAERKLITLKEKERKQKETHYFEISEREQRIIKSLGHSGFMYFQFGEVGEDGGT